MIRYGDQLIRFPPASWRAAGWTASSSLPVARPGGQG